MELKILDLPLIHFTSYESLEPETSRVTDRSDSIEAATFNSYRTSPILRHLNRETPMSGRKRKICRTIFWLLVSLALLIHPDDDDDDDDLLEACSTSNNASTTSKNFPCRASREGVDNSCEKDHNGTADEFAVPSRDRRTNSFSSRVFVIRY